MSFRLKTADVLQRIFPARKWKISAPTSMNEGNRSRVSASVSEDPVWFASSDEKLVPANEAWASAMLIPALHQQESLKICDALDRHWFENHLKLVSIFKEWWNYPAQSPIRSAHCIDRVTEGSETGLMFTCGADSFHSLLTQKDAVDSLIYVVGYDVTLNDNKRANTVISHVRRVAAECGTRAIIVYSNLREHPHFSKVSWNQTHGAGLAAVGHVLSGSLNTLLISASHGRMNPAPWGSHPHTDPLWSSGNLRIEYLSPATKRLDRLLAIADSPLVQRYLRVCWRNVGDDLNCSKCEKCVRTMLSLEIAGTLSRCPSFRGHTQLAERIRDLPPMAPTELEILFWEEMLDRDFEPRLQRAVRDLMQRSGYFESDAFRKAA
jgi:hypothetical protein